MDKKNLFDLQLFADEPADSAPGTAEKDDDKGAAADTGKEPAKSEAKYTDEDLDRIIGQKFAAWQKQQDKKVSEAERLSKMSAEEKANERIKQLEEKVAAAEKEKAVTAMAKQARAMLHDKGITVGDELLANLIADDAETTKASVESFISLFDAAVENRVKERLKGESPKAGSAPTGMTKEQILAIPNRAERQRLMKEHKDLF